MNQNEPFDEDQKSDILSFITPENLACDICSHVYDEIKKIREARFYFSDIENSSFTCYLDNMKACVVRVLVDENYNIVIKFNSNTIQIKNLSHVIEFSKNFVSYIRNLKELYSYVGENYDIVYGSDLTRITVYGNIECSGCEINRTMPYYFDCNETDFYLYDNNNRITFNSIKEMNEYVDLIKYKKTCKCTVCC
jgi:hypothetical protein